MVKLKSAFVVSLPILCILVLTTVVLAQEAVPAPYTGLKNPLKWDDTVAQNAGRSIYRRECLSCHGADGNEMIGFDFSTAEHRKELESKPDYKFWKVSEGVPGTEMIAWKSKLSETQRWQVLTYIWSLGSAPPVPVTPVVPGVPVTGGNTTTPVTPTIPGANVTPIVPGANVTSIAPGANVTGDNVTPVTPVTPPTAVAPITTANATIGWQLFTGRLPLVNNGPSCLACHNNRAVGVIGGGGVGLDLTGSYSLYGEGGLTSLLKKPRFPMMKEIYAVKPLTDGEIADMTAFLKNAGSSQSSSTPNPAILFIGSTAGALLIVLLFQVLWRGRLSGVRRQLVKGGSK